MLPHVALSLTAAALLCTTVWGDQIGDILLEASFQDADGAFGLGMQRNKGNKMLERHRSGNENKFIYLLYMQKNCIMFITYNMIDRTLCGFVSCILQLSI